MLLSYVIIIALFLVFSQVFSQWALQKFEFLSCVLLQLLFQVLYEKEQLKSEAIRTKSKDIITDLKAKLKNETKLKVLYVKLKNDLVDFAIDFK